MMSELLLYPDENGVLHEVPEFRTVVIFETKEEQERFEKRINNMNKYRWHDLRNNPYDVPDEPYEPVLVAIDIGCSEVDYDIFCYGIENWSARMVIAWKHIEPFEEEE